MSARWLLPLLLRAALMLSAISTLTWIAAELGRRQSRRTEAAAPAILSQQLWQFSYRHWPADCGLQPLLLVAIATAPPDFAARRRRRRLFCSVAQVGGFRLRCLFVLGAGANASVQRRVDAEASAAGDILQMTFADSYRNLTYKTLAAMDWTVSACPAAHFLLKTDLDSLVNPYNLAALLLQQRPGLSHRLYGGLRIDLGRPFRHSGPSKWRVSYEEYPWPTYAPYASGLGFLISRLAAVDMLNASNGVRVFPMEDAYVGLCASRAGVAVTDFWPQFMWELDTGDDWCWLSRAVVVHCVEEEEMEEMWRSALALVRQRPRCP